jgi:hypothetical protein
MTEKEMAAHIKALTKVIERQAQHTESLSRNSMYLQKQMSYIMARIAKLEGIKLKEF